MRTKKISPKYEASWTQHLTRLRRVHGLRGKDRGNDSRKFRISHSPLERPVAGIFQDCLLMVDYLPNGGLVLRPWYEIDGGITAYRLVG